jgi:hypothetical protein
MDFEKFKRIGAQTGLADTFKDCLTANKDDCADVAEDSFSEFTGLTKPNAEGAELVDFEVKFGQFKKNGAGLAAVKKTSACTKDAGTDTTKLGQCAELAQKEAAMALGEDYDIIKSDAGKKAKFDADYDRMITDAGANELVRTMRANKDASPTDRDAVALALFKNTTTKIYEDDKVAKFDFQKSKREGAGAGLVDTLKDCMTAGKSKEDCRSATVVATAEALGVDSATKESAAFKIKVETMKEGSAAAATADALKERMKARPGEITSTEALKADAKKFFKESYGMAEDESLSDIELEQRLKRCGTGEAIRGLETCMKLAKTKEAKDKCASTVAKDVSTAMGHARNDTLSPLDFETKVLDWAKEERTHIIMEGAVDAGMDKAERISAVRDELQTLSGGKNCSETEARRMIEKGTKSAVQDAIAAVGGIGGDLDKSAKDDVLKEAIARASGKSQSDVKTEDVEGYRRDSAVGRVALMVDACKDADATEAECLENAREAVTTALGRTKNVTDTELMRYRYGAAAEEIARMQAACLKTNVSAEHCHEQVEAKAESFSGKPMNGTELEKIVRGGAEGTALEYSMSCGDIAHDAYDKDKNKDEDALKVALKNCRDVVKQGLMEALGEKEGDDKNITEADVLVYVHQGTKTYAAKSWEACVAAAVVDNDCGSEENMLNVLIKATGNPLVPSEEAVALTGDVMAGVFLSAQRMGDRAADATDDKDAADTDEIMVKYDKEAKDYFFEATGTKLDGNYDPSMMQKKATADSIVDAALACSDVDEDCEDAEKLLSEAIATAEGRMPSLNKNATIDVPAGVSSTWTKEDKMYAMKREKQMRDADIELVAQRTDACEVAGYTEDDIEQCRDAVKDVREMITPNEGDWKVLDREQRADKAMKIYGACVGIGDDSEAQCETKAKQAAQKLVPKDGKRNETMETISSMKAKRNKARFAAEQSCGGSEKDVCMQATKEDLKLGKEYDMEKHKASKMTATDMIADCTRGMHRGTDEKRGDIELDDDCVELGLEYLTDAGFTAEEVKRVNTSKFMDLAKAKVEGSETNVETLDAVDSEVITAVACNDKDMEAGRQNIGNAAIDADATGAIKGLTVVLSHGATATGGCDYIYRTQAPKDKTKEVSQEINKIPDVFAPAPDGKDGRLRRLSSSGSVSSAPSEEEVKEGDTATDETSYENAGVDKHVDPKPDDKPDDKPGDTAPSATEDNSAVSNASTKTISLALLTIAAGVFSTLF